VVLAFLVGVPVMAAAVALTVFLLSRRQREIRRRRRSSADMMYDVREARRDARAWNSQHGFGDSNLRWTDASRRNRRGK
jgi:hypothetical protein